MEKRDRAYRRWKTFNKFVSRVKKRLDWFVRDSTTPSGIREAKNWKELNTDDQHEIKMLKKTSIRYSSKWQDYYDHIKIKKLRKDGKNIIDEELE